jgi:hypothetical protein
LVWAIWEDSDTGILKGVATKGIGGGIRVVERGVKRTGLIAVKQRLLALPVLVLLFVAIGLLLYKKKRDWCQFVFDVFAGPVVSIQWGPPLTSRVPYRLTSLAWGEWDELPETGEWGEVVRGGKDIVHSFPAEVILAVKNSKG